MRILKNQHTTYGYDVIIFHAYSLNVFIWFFFFLLGSQFHVWDHNLKLDLHFLKEIPVHAKQKLKGGGG